MSRGRGSLSGVSVEVGLCPGGLCPGGLCPGGSLSRVRGSLYRVRGSLSRGSLSGRPLDRDPPYGNVRAVRILLKCILVVSSERFPCLLFQPTKFEV